MSLTTEDKQFITGTVQTVIDSAVEDRIRPMVDDAVETLALTVHTGFEAADRRMDGIESDVSEIKSDIRHIKFDLAGTVHRSEHNELKFRVDRLEGKDTKRV